MNAGEKEQLVNMLSERAGHPVNPLDPAKYDSVKQSDFDAYAHILEGKGYQVLRVPYLEPLDPGDPYFSYNNCLMERFDKDGQPVRRVFLPHYGVQKLDDIADNVWKSQGFDVHPIPLATLSSEWGALRCVSNWIDRSPRG